MRFDSRRWQESLGAWWPEDAPDNDLISRDDVFRAARNWREGKCPASDVFVLTMAWGYGPVGYGRYRTLRALSTAGSGDRLERALGALRDETPATPGQLAAAYESLTWRGENRLRGLGPAFFTKLLYFAGYRPGAAGLQPLILDARVARSLKSAGGPQLSSWGWSSEQWLTYLSWAADQAAARGVPTDCIELELFRQGGRR